MESNATGSSRPAVRRPTIIAGTDTTLLGRPVIAPDRAAGAGFYALDLDLRKAWHPSLLDTLSSSEPLARVRSAWIPRQYTGPWRDTRAGHLRDWLTTAVDSYGLRTVIVPGTETSRSHGTSLGPLARQVTALSSLRVAMRIAPETLLAREGSHLDHVANLRRMAEEWDLDLALDLTAPGIEAWETEAALMRVFPRLTLVRIRPLHAPDGTPSPDPNARLALRTLTMLADQAFTGTISIAPVTPPLAHWVPGITGTLAPAALTREEVLALWDRVNQQDLPHRHERQQFG